MYLRVVTYNPFHSVCFSGRRLSVGKNSSIVSGKYVRDNAFCSLAVYFFLRRIWFEYFIK